MADYSANRPIDDFLINPTVKMEDHYERSRLSTSDDEMIPIALSNEIIAIRNSKFMKQPEQGYPRLVDEPAYWHAYTSDEELASPVENDDSGFPSTDNDTESAPSLKENSSFEDLPATANAVQLCSQAQAVQLKSAGKPKVVSVPKLVDVPAAPESPRSATSARFKAPSPDLKRMSWHGSVRLSSSTYSSSPRSSTERSADSPTQDRFSSQPGNAHTIRRKVNLPPLETIPSTGAVRTSGSRTQTPLAAQRADFLKHDPYPSSTSNASPGTPSPKSKMHKLSSSFSLRGIGRSRRQNSVSGSIADDKLEYYRYSEPTVTSPLSPDFSTPTSTPSKPKTRLVPRGANERAPPIVLPPCPYDENDWDIGRSSPDWPLRKQSVPAISTLDRSPPVRKQNRRSSLSSAAFVTAQA